MNPDKYSKTRISCYTGYVSQAITVNLAPLLFVIFQNSYKVSLSYIAALTLITFLVQILIDCVAVKYIERMSYRFLAVSCQLLSFIGLVFLSFLPSLIYPQAGIIISVILYSTGSGLAEVLLSPLIESLPSKETKGFTMTLMHSFYAWGQAAVILFTTLILKIIGSDNWFILPILWSLVPLVNAISFTIVPLSDMTIHEEGHGVFGLLRDKTFLLCVLMMICAGATEQAMAQWTSYFAEKGLGVSKVLGDILGPCMFAVMMALGRTAHGLIGKKVDLNKLMSVLSAFCTICYVVTVVSPVPLISLFACGFSGLGVSVMWPGMISLSTDTFKGAGASMYALLALGGDIGCSLGPWITGTVSDFAKSGGLLFLSQSSETVYLKAGFGVALIFPIIMTLGLIILCKKRKVLH